ncbi:hypothetical protein ACFOW6_04660 [Fodinicurvata halophila]|uniref:Uncharacterized protein n=1 Tax=Fodinicurvata halophila TaxID=1419723 RepID=A0ABV8UJ59_9PROT
MTIRKSIAAVSAAGMLAACTNIEADPATAAQNDSPDLVTKQDAGNIVYWVPPGPRKLSPTVFGTAEDPKMTLQPKLQKAQEMVEAGKMPPSVPQLLKDLPILVGVPEKARSQGPDGEQILDQPTPFPNKGQIIEGSFRAEFFDEVDEDTPGKPGETPDSANLTAEFTDPQGNDYKVVLDHVVKPPFPGYQTDGGVMLDDVHHGSTGTGTPLMPQVWSIGALWGIGEVHVNGEVAAKHQVVHLMTTETVRTTDYQLALQEDMPLAPDEWHVKGQPHHTHLIVLPMEGTPEGPVFSPVPTAFELPNGETQPFMHIMFEEDTVER